MNSTFVQVGVALAQAVALLMSVAFITYVVIMLARARPQAVHPMMYAVAGAFAAFFIWHN